MGRSIEDIQKEIAKIKGVNNKIEPITPSSPLTVDQFAHLPNDKFKDRKATRRDKKLRKKAYPSYAVRIVREDDSVYETVVTTKNPYVLRIEGKSYYITNQALRMNRNLGIPEIEYLDGHSLPLIGRPNREQIEGNLTGDNAIAYEILSDATLFDKFCDGTYAETIIQAYKTLDDRVKLMIVLLAGNLVVTIVMSVINYLLSTGGGA